MAACENSIGALMHSRPRTLAPPWAMAPAASSISCSNTLVRLCSEAPSSVSFKNFMPGWMAYDMRLMAARFISDGMVPEAATWRA
jgi:hypothetical protein